MGRTKGLPYSRMMLKGITPAEGGKRAVLHLKHPTRKTACSRAATPDLLRVFMPGLAPELADIMLAQ